MGTTDQIDQESLVTNIATGDEFPIYQASSKRTKKVTSDLMLPLTGRFRFLTAPVGWAAYSSTGTNTTLVNGTTLFADVVILKPSVPLTGIGVLNGATVGTDKGIVYLYDSAGNLLANSRSRAPPRQGRMHSSNMHSLHRTRRSTPAASGLAISRTEPPIRCALLRRPPGQTC
jgi:hypothetical protein